MDESNPYAPPRSSVADADRAAADIESLPVSARWKARFRAIRDAGGPKLPDLKSLPPRERRRAFGFNILAFLFGPFYYLAKGMWRRGAMLFLAVFAALLIVQIVLDALGYGRFGKYLSIASGVVFAIRANIDYYKKMVLRDNGWW